MGGRAVFVWSSYAITISTLLGLLVLSVIERTKIIKQAIKQKARVEKIMAARQAKRAAKQKA
ncbi:heme exporter protein CcmD [Glaciecola petra]|uniref:Heme exporter protein D n=1 Tax=Glaciecola petra TaxID=3075602 RepID=A0ABU2ZLZ0_9ALTE|nr:heme exporter protein CcmD [Aestuariibacter sp. P117]MDT0593643.1 heme exporter protein CcmD [Aestuariibacter sp. P117]